MEQAIGIPVRELEVGSRFRTLLTDRNLVAEPWPRDLRGLDVLEGE
jgi:hypothetical protein